MNLASLFSTAHQTYSRERAAELSCAARASHFPLTFGPSMGLTLTSRGRYAVQIVPDDLSAESNHCAAGAARTAKLARRAQGRMPGVKAIAPASPMRWSRIGTLCFSQSAGRPELAHPCAQTYGPFPRRPLRCSAPFKAQEPTAKEHRAERKRRSQELLHGSCIVAFDLPLMIYRS